MNKEYLKSYLYGVEVRIAAKITDTVLRRDLKRTVLKEVKQQIKGLQLFSDVEKNRLWQWTTAFYRHCVAGAGRKTDPSDRAKALYAVLRNDTPELEHVKNELADTVEYRKKHADLVDMLRNLDNRFYYCTVHKDCAAGHRDYQGQFYFKEGIEYTKEERKFIREHKLLSVNSVVLGPVWLTTRRNCRHKLVPVPFERVRNGDFSVVSEGNDISYADSQYRNYKDRYKLYISIKKEFKKNEVDIPRQMKTDMKRTADLIRAWKK